MSKEPAAPLPALGQEVIRQHLERILASATFRQVDRLKRFLRFIVEEAAAGRSDQLKEYVIGVQVFGKEPTFDPRADPIVRVQARRLRTRLARYYEDEGRSGDIIIELRKGSYAPAFKPPEAATSGRRSVSAALVTQNTIAVLPFADHSPGRDFGFFCDALRQEIIHALTLLSHLRVMAWEPASGSATDARQAVSAVHAALVVTGSVRAAGGRARIVTHLVDGASGSYLSSDVLECDATDFEAQLTVAATLTARLQANALSGRQLRGRPSENLAARNLYIQGRYHLDQRTEEGLRKAVDFFERAIAEDSQFALAHSGLADAYGLLAHYGVYEPAQVWTKSASSAAAAVMLDDSSAEAHTSFAHVKATQEWDWHAAEAEFQIAISRDPTYATAHHWYAMSCLVPLGRLEEAREELLMAQSLDPVSAIVTKDLALVHLYRRDLEAALEQCDQAIELNPHFSPAYWTLGVVQEHRKDFDESAAAFQRAIHLAPQAPRMQSAVARTLALAGKRKPALAIVKKLEEMARERYVSPIEFAAIRFALDENDDGFRWLTTACSDRCFELLALRVDPRFDSIAADPRFTAIVAQIGLS